MDFFSPTRVTYFLTFRICAAKSTLDMPKTMEKGKGGKGKGKGKGKGVVEGRPQGPKGVCKGSSAGVGSAYAAPGRPKIFRPTDDDRKQTGNIAEYFKSAEKTTPQPLAPVFASGARSATSSIPVPSTQVPAPTTGHSTQVIDVGQAAQETVAEGLDRLIADYSSGSDDADAS